MPRPLTLFNLGVLFAALLGCKKAHEDAPRVPTSGGNSVFITTRSDAGPLDAGPVEDDEDAGPIAVRQIECRNVEALPEAGEDPVTHHLGNAFDEPIDFRVSRVVATWDLACAPPTLRLVMSDGKCPDGDGHELSFRLNVNAIESKRIVPGPNQIVSEMPDDEPSHDIRVRYTRPSRLDPAGEWGTCGNGASGEINFRGDLSTAAFKWFEADFQGLMLPACDGSANEIQQLTGSFYIQLRRGVDEACPLRKLPAK